MACPCCACEAPVAIYRAREALRAADYTTEFTYVNFDTASQHMWATAAQRQEQPEAPLQLTAETSWFAFMQIVHTIPQHTSLQHHILVLVFAKEVDNPLTSAVVVVQRKHVEYDQGQHAGTYLTKICITVYQHIIFMTTKSS